MKKVIDNKTDNLNNLLSNDYCQCKRCPHCGKLIATGWLEYPVYPIPGTTPTTLPPNVTWCNNATDRTDGNNTTDIKS